MKKNWGSIGKFIIIPFFFILVLFSYFLWDYASGKSVEAKPSLDASSKKTSSNMQQSVKKEPPSNKQIQDQKNKDGKDLKKTNHEKKEDNQVTEKDQREEATSDKPEKPLASNEKPMPTVQPEVGKVVYLTFDDGPHPSASKEILQLLNKYNAKATYFMLEPNMEKNSDVVQQMIDEGHTLGVHGITHDVSKVYKSPDRFVFEMNEAIAYIEKSVSVHTRLVRAPYGSKPYITPPFKEAIDHEQFIMWDWTVDSADWRVKRGEYVQNTINQINRLTGKEPLIVLLHEKPTTAAHLEKLLKYFSENGYRMEAIDETMIPIQFKQ